MVSLVKKLIKKKLKISFAESCTGGMLASSITSISGASKIFNIGLITYSNQAKIKFLKVNKNIIKQHSWLTAPYFLIISFLTFKILIFAWLE